ncbi:hypothetical protein HPP92_024292 [Vanilla planifolia]|uniref:1-phosphatidylinositol 4-kinase n=1 Tax=Vanilla planifolia TaxID=51239 RepID=A0A835UB72_VANPL|nr:hypothetical protein HPP92_024292 [Vanilla planifolia]
MSSAGIAINPIEDELLLPSFRQCSPCLSDSILVYLAVHGISAIPMRILESDSIASVKLRIESCKGFVVKKQRLVFDGRELARNECLVKDYGVADGNVLHLVIRLSDLSVITVKTVCGKKFKFHVEKSRTVAYVKQQIAKRGKDLFDLDSQNLVYEGKELEDRWLIQDICKYNDAVIHLYVCENAKVRTKPTNKDVKLSISAPIPSRDDTRFQTNDLEIISKKTFPRDVWIEPYVVNPKIVLSPAIKDLIGSALAGLEKGNPPVMSSEGTGGAYFMQDILGQEFVAVFKPIDEEPMAKNNPRGLPLSMDGIGLKKGTRVGEGALREVAAYLLDHPVKGRKTSLCGDIGFSGVPRP